jgi:hypothetical protein
VVLGDKVNGALIAIVLRYGMMRHFVICAALFCAFQLSAHATTLLPSQEEHDLVTVKTCRDHEVLSSLKAAIDRSLQASSVLARGMHAGDVHLEAVWIDQPAVICSTTVAANGIRERIVYTVALEGSSYVIKFGGEPGGSKLFPYQLEVRPINMDMPPGCSGPIATRPQRCFAATQAGDHLQY